VPGGSIKCIFTHFKTEVLLRSVVILYIGDVYSLRSQKGTEKKKTVNLPGFFG